MAYEIDLRMHYDSVDDTAIYAIVKNHLPLLKKKVAHIIEKNKD